MAINRTPVWTWLAPLAGWILLGVSTLLAHPVLQAGCAAGLIACVLAAVHHAEVVAHRVGEPFGTLVLALAVTIIEVALIVSLMLTGGEGTASLARDTVFAAVMIILNGMVGVSLLLGASRHGEQAFGLYGVNASLAALATIAVLTLVLPNTTTSIAGPVYAPSQLALVAASALVIYGVFVLVQTVRHRDYFLPAGDPANDQETHLPPPSTRAAWISAVLLLACLGAVVLLAKALAPAIEAAVDAAGAPKAVVGVVIAAIVLLPESLAALRAARANRLQTSMNLALGSALASIGLTIPAVALLSIITDQPLALGLDAKNATLLALSLFVAVITLGTGRTTVLQGIVHLVLFAAFLFL